MHTVIYNHLLRKVYFLEYTVLMENMRKKTTLPPIRYFNNLTPDTYEHPHDHAALEALRRIPGLDKVFKAIASSGFEPIQYTLNIANNIRVTPSQEKDIYRIFKHAVHSLNITEPELYITNDRNLNAFTSGVSKPWIVLNSGIIESLSAPELLWVISHELGHILSGHVLYHSTAQYLLGFGSSQLSRIPIIGELLGGIATDALLLSLLKWYRMSEFTADRVAHLVVGDTSIGISVLYKLSGGYVSDTMEDLDAFLAQANDYSSLDQTLAGKAALLFSGALLLSHPFAVVRAKAIADWSSSSEYVTVLDNFMSDDCVSCSTTKCTSCGGLVNDVDLYCHSCGHRLRAPYLAAKQDKLSQETSNETRSALPGGLGKRANEILDDSEIILYEIAINTGIGVVVTQYNTYIIRGGLLAAGDFNKIAEEVYENVNIKYYIYKVSDRYLFVINDPPSELELKALSELSIDKLRSLAPAVIPIQSAALAKKLSTALDVDITDVT